MILHNYPYQEGKLLLVQVRGRAVQSIQIIRAAEYYASLLFKEKDALKLEVFIILTNKLQEGLEGLCDYNYDRQFPEFEIEINSNASIDNMLLTLAHEMIHAKQMYYKELISVSHNMRWQGKPVIESTGQPWEDEAEEYEQVLFNKWKEYVEQKKERSSHS